jgi:hypothetical protein
LEEKTSEETLGIVTLVTAALRSVTKDEVLVYLFVRERETGTPPIVRVLFDSLKEGQVLGMIT